MKTLMIERVSNGWVVRPFSCGPDWAVGTDAPQIFVYKTIEEIQADLPRLLTDQIYTYTGTDGVRSLTAHEVSCKMECDP